MNIPSFYSAFGGGPDIIFALLGAFALKGAVILGAASVISFALRRASASARRLVWLLAIVGVLCAPILSLITPPLHMPTPVTTTRPTTPLVLESETAIHEGPVIMTKSGPAEMRPEPSVIDRRFFLLGAWGAIAAILLVRLAVGFALAGRTARRCLPVTDEKLKMQSMRLAEEMGVRRRVGLRQGALAAVPMTTGVWRPVVLLPIDAGDWPAGRLEAALRHEMAHIRRRDWVWRGLTGMMCAIHWFNPLAWIAAHQLNMESERACDDAVLTAGTRSTDYAGHLLEIARGLSHPDARRPGAAIAMAQRPQVENRLRAILRAGQDRRGVTRTRLIAGLAAAALLLAPISALRTAAQDQSQIKAAEDAKALTSLSNMRQIALALIIYATDHNGNLPDADHWMDAIDPQMSKDNPGFFSAIIRDPSAPNLTYGYAFNKALSGVNIANLKDPDQVVMIFESTLGARNAADTGASVPSPGRHQGGVTYMFADGRGHWVQDGIPVSFSPTISSQSQEIASCLGTASFTGKVVYEDGRPAPGVRVAAQVQHEEMTKLFEAANGNLLLPHGVTMPLPPGAARPTNEQARKVTWSEAVTGADGSYHLSGLTSARYNIAVMPKLPKADDGQEQWTAAAIEGVQGEEGKAVSAPDLVLTQGGFVEGMVKDKLGRALPNIVVYGYGPSRPTSSAMVISTKTDTQGRYRLRVAPGENFVYIADGNMPGPQQTVTVRKGETRTVDFTQ